MRTILFNPLLPCPTCQDSLASRVSMYQYVVVVVAVALNHQNRRIPDASTISSFRHIVLHTSKHTVVTLAIIWSLVYVIRSLNSLRNT